MVYLLCFHRKYKHAKHYIGFCEDGKLDARLAKHRKGTGARLMEVIMKAGIGFDLARLWPTGSRDFERLLKNRKNAARICPICNANAMKKGNYVTIDTETNGFNLDGKHEPIVETMPSEAFNCLTATNGSTPRND